MTQREIIKEASSHLDTINQGIINIPKIKNFLSRLGQSEAVPPAGKPGMKARRIKYSQMK